MKALRTIILAAGKGARMKSELPKVLHTVCGKTLLQYIIDIAKSIGSGKIFIVLGYKRDVVQMTLPKDATAVLQKRLLGTADAVRCTQKFFRGFRGDVLILCADTPLLRKTTVKSLIRKHKKTKAACTVLTMVVHNPDGYGRIIRDESGRVVAIREDKDAVGLERNIAEVNTGAYCFRSQDLFSFLKGISLNAKKKEFYLTDIIALLKEKDLRVETIETEDSKEALGINTREDLAVAGAVLRQRVLKELMDQGVSIVDPQTTYIDASAKIGKDTTIRPFTVIENNVTIGRECMIGPFARLRAGTRIGDAVEVGNFTEVSRTRIGHRTLMKHFSFLGDALVGKKVNIGAGTVTANFDGKDKNTTRIDDNAFIGSDSVLIAPVRIGRGAVVGAGSVVTRNKHIPAGKVAMGVPAKVIVGRRKG
ncbi:MAG: NTP transferase domain-containing protein [Candidatus Omnitrophota bacterium]|nr:NTP transferase domain-containing protein [Candidatus Omnitrophota bacterium]